MAEIIITSSPASARMTCKINQSTLTPSWKMFEFALTELGANPNIGSALLSVTVTGDPAIRFQAKVNNNTHVFLPNETADLTEDVSRALNDGKLSFSLAYFGTPSGSQTAYADVSCRLTVVTAAPVVTDTRSTGVLSASSVAFGQSVSMTITPLEDYAATYTHAVTWSVGNFQTTTQVAAGVTSASFTVPTAWMSEVPAATSGTLRVILDTLSDGESVGTREYTAQVTVPDNVMPTAGTLSASAVNTGALESMTDKYFAGASRIAMTLSGATAGNGSSIASIVFDGWGESITTTETSVITGILQNSGSMRIRATVTDRRGRAAVTTVDIKAEQYSPPYFTDIEWIRCRADGSPDDKGNAVMVSAEFGCSTEVFDHNTATAYVELHAKGSEDWSSKITLVNGQDTLITTMELLTTVSYEMRFTVKDSVTQVVRYITIPSSHFLFHFSNNGQSIGVGQAAEPLAEGETGRVSFNPEWDVYFGQNIHVGSQTLEEYIQSIVTAMQGS